jgi:anti-anti-sigma regulatory factor
MRSELFIGRLADGIVLRLVGRGTIAESIALRKAIEPFFSTSLIVFDASCCPYMDSTFLGCLVGIKKDCDRIVGCRFVVVASAASQSKLFSTSSLDRYFAFLEECPEITGPCSSILMEEVERSELGRHVMCCHQNLADLGGEEAKAFQAIVSKIARELDEQNTSIIGS